jgi:hypothetical protein
MQKIYKARHYRVQKINKNLNIGECEIMVNNKKCNAIYNLTPVETSISCDAMFARFDEEFNFNKYLIAYILYPHGVE